uniref:Uncharacterized protein n=1 Tax=Sphaerodactylus townsendi TaxID=933632 RepID=A0ACB8FG31_9SAUR
MPIEGDNLVLSCLANKFLYKDIAWILPRTVNNQTRVKKATTKEYSIDLTLTIKNISLEHSGSYACRARNIYTGEEVLQKKDVTVRATMKKETVVPTEIKINRIKLEAKIEFSIFKAQTAFNVPLLKNAQEAPFLLRNLTDQVVNTSHSVTLECLVHGLPEPQISWLKNNKEIQHQPGIILGPGSQSLLIERVQEEDGGLYRCVAANLKGVVESSAFVTVQDFD